MDATTARFDRTLRIVMWCDASLSTAIVAVGVIGAPVAAAVPMSDTARFVLAIAVLVTAVLLAAFGAVTAVVLMVRLHRGVPGLPPRLWLPLPDPLRPAAYRRHHSGPRVKSLSALRQDQ
ncbi:MAG: hypothetical protein ACTHMS_15825 [Jatrophihabitans sp.]|uniref:hypothetical protein n=1 Tax=Jatrophihabitans sp. TaxID=1932789 RepID=UPI003F7D445F